MITLIVAKNEKNVIGDDNQLIWHLPDDLKHFKQLTTGHPVLMGRKTFDSIGKPLPNRLNIVITRNPDWCFDGAEVAHSLEEAVEIGLEANPDIFIIGGEKIFEESMEIADAIELTEIYNQLDGDALFPEIDPEIWEEVSRQDFKKDEKNQFDYSFIRYEKRKI